MKTGQIVFILFIVTVLLVGTYLIVQAQKPKTITPPIAPSEPTANIWTVIGGIMDIFGQKEEKEEAWEHVEETEAFKAGLVPGPPQYPE